MVQTGEKRAAAAMEQSVRQGQQETRCHSARIECFDKNMI
jgi:hypothetical protein